MWKKCKKFLLAPLAFIINLEGREAREAREFFLCMYSDLRKILLNLD